MSIFRRPSADPSSIDFDPGMDDLELRAARDAAMRGDWTPAHKLLVVTGRDWDRRGHRINVLAQMAAQHPQWLRSWLADQPDDAAALAVLGWSEIHRAWLARGGDWARRTSAGAFEDFFTILKGASDLCYRAVEAAPDDPTPWVPLLWLAIGQQSDARVFRACWGQLRARDPLNRLGHVAALQYLCEKWHGSHEQMYSFAREAVAEAPEGSPLAVLPLQAHIEYDLRVGTGGLRGSYEAVRLWRGADVHADIATALEGWLGVTGGHAYHAMAVHDRSVLAYALVNAEMWPQAAEQFRAMGPYGFPYPWSYRGDGRAVFAKARAKALRRG